MSKGKNKALPGTVGEAMADPVECAKARREVEKAVRCAVPYIAEQDRLDLAGATFLVLFSEKADELVTGEFAGYAVTVAKGLVRNFERRRQLERSVIDSSKEASAAHDVGADDMFERLDGADALEEPETEPVLRRLLRRDRKVPAGMTKEGGVIFLAPVPTPCTEEDATTPTPADRAVVDRLFYGYRERYFAYRLLRARLDPLAALLDAEEDRAPVAPDCPPEFLPGERRDVNADHRAFFGYHPADEEWVSLVLHLGSEVMRTFEHASVDALKRQPELVERYSSKGILCALIGLLEGHEDVGIRKAGILEPCPPRWRAWLTEEAIDHLLERSTLGHAGPGVANWSGVVLAFVNKHRKAEGLPPLPSIQTARPGRP